MPKGRGSNERRRSPRQRRAVAMSKLAPDDPVAIRFTAARGRRLVGKRNPWNFAVADHEPHTWTLQDHPRTKKAKKQRDENARRRAKNWR